MQQLPRLIEKSYPQEDADCKLPRIVLSKAGARVRILVKSENSEDRQLQPERQKAAGLPSSVLQYALVCILHFSMCSPRISVRLLCLNSQINSSCQSTQQRMGVQRQQLIAIENASQRALSCRSCLNWSLQYSWKPTDL